MNKKILIGLGIIIAVGLFFAAVSSAEEDLSQTDFCSEIKTATLNLQVSDVKDAQEKILNFIQEKEGEIARSVITQSGNNSFGTTIVRVPVENFEEALAHFKELGQRVTYEKIDTENISQNCLSEPRLENLEESESQLLKIIKKEGKISELLDAQKELDRVREEIRKINEQRQDLENKANMATINLNLGLSVKPLPEGWRQTNFLTKSLGDLMTFLSFVSYFLFEVIVWSVVWAPLLLIILYLKKSRRKAAKKI